MMKKRKFGSGGSTKRPMPTPADRAASKAQDAMLKKVTPTKSEAKTLASAARASKNQNAMKGYAKGGKVKPINIDMKGLEEASRPKASLPKADLEAKGAEARKANAAQAKEAKKQSFRDAFAAARKRGDKTFSWNGGSYGTQMAGEKPKAKSKAESSNPFNPKTSLKSIARNTDTNNAKLSDAQMERYQKGLDTDADRSLAAMRAAQRAKDAKTEATQKQYDADADRSLAAIKAAKDKPRFSLDTAGLGRATTAGLSEAAKRGAMKATGMKKGGSVTRGDGITKKGKTKGKMV